MSWQVATNLLGFEDLGLEASIIRRLCVTVLQISMFQVKHSSCRLQPPKMRALHWLETVRSDDRVTL
jgi:hypothetical protein